jgi:hypothetical protein
VNWKKNNSVVIRDNPYTFKATDDIKLVGNFEVLIPFNDYVVTKWNNTFMLNIKKLEAEGYDLKNCKWFINGKEIGAGFTYSAGKRSSDQLQVGANYYFELATYSHGNVHSTNKVIEPPSGAVLRVYPNPLPQGSKLVIEGTVQGALIEVFSQNGSCVSSSTASGTVTELILDVPVGIYVVRSNKEEVKVIIQ